MGLSGGLDLGNKEKRKKEKMIGWHLSSCPKQLGGLVLAR